MGKLYVRSGVEVDDHTDAEAFYCTGDVGYGVVRQDAESLAQFGGDVFWVKAGEAVEVGWGSPVLSASMWLIRAASSKSAVMRGMCFLGFITSTNVV